MKDKGMCSMKVLIINSGCLKVNCSANLCHIAYIQGFVDAGAEVTVLSKSTEGQIVDEFLKLPSGVKYIEIKGSVMASKFGGGIKTSINLNGNGRNNVIRSLARSIVLKLVDVIYGEMGVSQIWINNVVKQFRSQDKYDLVLSLSGPVSSHFAAAKLLKKGRVHTDCFCELWEDPWQYDLLNSKINSKKLLLEEAITSDADFVLYVSPITLNNQRHLFSRGSSKMDWLPLPYYYRIDKNEAFDSYSYGYFGDYYPNARNILPFYDAARKLQLQVYICGNPVGLIDSVDNIHVLPRVGLKELAEYENQTNVLVIVCNLSGGQLPGKIYQYAATNKKILFILDGTFEEKKIIRDYFSQFNRFYFCDNNTDSIMESILFLENDDKLCCKPIDFFSPKRIAEEIMKKCNLFA